jgi:hypothetical protein
MGGRTQEDDVHLDGYEPLVQRMRTVHIDELRARERLATLVERLDMAV